MAKNGNVGSDEHFREVLEDWYEEVMRLGEYLYIAKENEIYYLMLNKEEIPTFYTYEATMLQGVTSIEVENNYLTYTRKTSKEGCRMTFASIKQAVKEMVQGA